MDMPEHRPFGAVLRGYRVAAGLSQQELAERAQLSPRTLSDLERGVTSGPYRRSVALLAAALGLDAAQRARFVGDKVTQLVRCGERAVGHAIVLLDAPQQRPQAGLTRGRSLGRELLQRGADEHAHALIGRVD